MCPLHHNKKIKIEKEQRLSRLSCETDGKRTGFTMYQIIQTT